MHTDFKGDRRGPEERHAALWDNVRTWLKDPQAGEVRHQVAQHRSRILIGYGVRELEERGLLASVRPDLAALSSALVEAWLSAVQAAELARTGDEYQGVPPVEGYAEAETGWNSMATELLALEARMAPSSPSKGTDIAMFEAKIKVGEKLARLSGSQLVGAR